MPGAVVTRPNRAAMTSAQVTGRFLSIACLLSAEVRTVPGTQKALSLPGKGLDLRKLVAGAGFEPATSGL